VVCRWKQFPWLVDHKHAEAKRSCGKAIQIGEEIRQLSDVVVGWVNSEVLRQVFHNVVVDEVVLWTGEFAIQHGVKS